MRAIGLEEERVTKYKQFLFSNFCQKTLENCGILHEVQRLKPTSSRKMRLIRFEQELNFSPTSCLVHAVGFSYQRTNAQQQTGNTSVCCSTRVPLCLALYSRLKNVCVCLWRLVVGGYWGVACVLTMYPCVPCVKIWLNQVKHVVCVCQARSI